jgi:hypothetical protein
MQPESVPNHFEKTDALLATMKASTRAVRLLEMARRDAPVASAPMVAGQASTRIACMPKKSSGRPVLFEHGSFVYLAQAWYESDENVVEFHCRPCLHELLEYDERENLRSRRTHVFDFLVMYENGGLILEDWRSGRFFSRLRESRTERYEEVPFNSGIWIDRLAEQFARANGVGFALRSAGELPRELIDHLQADNRLSGAPRLSAVTRQRLEETVRESRSLKELLDLGFTVDELYMGVVHGVVYVDLKRELLREPQNLLFHSSALPRPR